MPLWLLSVFISLSFLGFLDALYLTVSHYAGAAPACGVFDGCAVVAASAYAAIGGVPLALLGVIYYFSIFLLFLDYLWRGNKRSVRLAVGLAGAGFLISLYFLYLQIYVIEAICLYCVASAIISTAIFFFGLAVLFLAGGGFSGSFNKKQSAEKHDRKV